MASGLRYLTPEEEELSTKLAELEQLESEMAQRELDLATLMAELQAFERRYAREVGVRIAELDQLEADLADRIARQAVRDRTRGAGFGDRRSQKRLAEAQARAQQSAGAADPLSSAGQAETFDASPELKALFRDLAKRIHPDLAEGHNELARRTQLMAEANAAYQRGDVTRLEQIVLEWNSAPETVRGEGLGADLVRVIRRIARARRRLDVIEGEITCLTASDLFQLRTEVERARAEGYDLLADMADEIDDRAEDARERIELVRFEESGHGRLR